MAQDSHISSRGLKGAVEELHRQHPHEEKGVKEPKEMQHEKGYGPNGPGKTASMP